MRGDPGRLNGGRAASLCQYPMPQPAPRPAFLRSASAARLDRRFNPWKWSPSRSIRLLFCLNPTGSSARCTATAAPASGGLPAIRATWVCAGITVCRIVDARLRRRYISAAVCVARAQRSARWRPEVMPRVCSRVNDHAASLRLKPCRKEDAGGGVLHLRLSGTGSKALERSQSRRKRSRWILMIESRRACPGVGRSYTARRTVMIILATGYFTVISYMRLIRGDAFRCTR